MSQAEAEKIVYCTAYQDGCPIRNQCRDAIECLHSSINHALIASKFAQRHVPRFTGQQRCKHGWYNCAECEAKPASATPTANDPISTLLAARSKTHGNFSDHARITCRLKDIILDECTQRAVRSQPALTLPQREALDMILHKIGRVLAGDSSFRDHWDDIAGYAQLVAERCPK